MSTTPVRHYLDWSTRGRDWLLLYLLGLMVGFSTLLLGGLFIAPFKPETDDAMLGEAWDLHAFAAEWAVIPLFVWVALGRPGYSVAVACLPPRLRNYVAGVVIGLVTLSLMFAVYGPLTGVEYVGLDNLGRQNLAVLLFLVVGLVVQTGAEEIFFRGLVAQATVRLFRRFSPMVVLIGVLVLPSLWFAQLHINNIEEYGGHWTSAIPYFTFAVALAWVAYRTGSILISMGLHLANNAFLVLIVTSDKDVLAGPAPFVTTADPVLWRSIVFSATQAALTVLLAELAVRRGWLEAPPVGEGEPLRAGV